ncbi:MAG: GNAT family N-acetyltransferase [Bacteroidia bacterium]|jgi:aminoglycoside 3-N-acetyltransferase I|nr:GNAT family N-acetyltransferase [Bacteroidia bacterium]
MNIHYRKLVPGEEEILQQLIQLYIEIFERDDAEELSPEFLRTLLASESMFFLAAFAGNNELTGGLTVHLLPSVYHEKPEVYIYDFAVKENLQRTGIGTGLLNELKRYCSDKNYGSIFVQAETIDNHALKFYRKNGGDENDVRHFTF